MARPGGRPWTPPLGASSAPTTPAKNSGPRTDEPFLPSIPLEMPPFRTALVTTWSHKPKCGTQTSASGSAPSESEAPAPSLAPAVDAGAAAERGPRHEPLLARALLPTHTPPPQHPPAAAPPCGTPPVRSRDCPSLGIPTVCRVGSGAGPKGQEHPATWRHPHARGPSSPAAGTGPGRGAGGATAGHVPAARSAGTAGWTGAA